MSIPNELKITLNTSIPGFQNIRYKPNMTIPDDNSSSVQFDPLVKLKRSVIDSLPKNIQIKEFFNKGLFQSLVNAHGLVRAKTLVEATKDGYVDNNIRVTIETLFPVNSVIYIANQSYVIADVLWRKGDWKIDKKILQVPQINFNRINDPYLLTTLAKEQLSSGQSELETLPKEVLYGNSYVPPPPNAPPIGPIRPTGYTGGPAPNGPAPNGPAPNGPQGLPPKKGPKPSSGPSGAPSPNAPPLGPSGPPPKPPSPSGPSGAPPPKPTPPTGPSGAPPPKPRKGPLPLPPINNGKAPLPLPPIPPPNPPPPPPPQNKIEKATYEIKLNPSKNNTADFRRYFVSNYYYSMINYMVNNMDEGIKKIIDKIMINTTGVAVKESKNLSQAAYKKTVEGTRIYSNSGGGDCFFIAVADGINYHNRYADPSDKIYYNNYGNGNMIFTQQILRTIVSEFILNLNSTILTDMINTSENMSNFLNDEFIDFKNNIPPMTSQDEKLTLLNNLLDNLYSREDSFLIKKQPITALLLSKPIFLPFSIIKNKNEIDQYIKSSDYWANYVAIDALVYVLSLSVINIEQDFEGRLRVPYINNSVNWNSYMFLFYKNSHYELISFEYITQKIQKQPKLSVKTIKNTETIFNKINNIVPPFWLIFLIFGSNYINILDNNDKQNYPLLPDIFNSLKITFDNILAVPDNENKEKFLSLFEEYFEPSILRGRKKKSRREIMSLPKIENSITSKKLSISFGGAPINSQNPNFKNRSYNPYNNLQRPYAQNNPNNPYNQYNQYNPYNQGYPRLTLNNSVNEGPVSNISYYISIDLELKKGTTLSLSDKVNLKCNQQFNKIRKNLADLTGMKYSIMPVYDNLPSIKEKTIKSQSQNITKKGGHNNRKNITRKKM